MSWIYRHGDEPDPRFTLANERTLLAWTRTALALIAGGVALETLALPLQPDLRFSAALTLLAAGFLTPLLAWIGWGRAERAMRMATPLPPPVVALPLTLVVILVAAMVILGILLGP